MYHLRPRLMIHGKAIDRNRALTSNVNDSTSVGISVLWNIGLTNMSPESEGLKAKTFVETNCNPMGT